MIRAAAVFFSLLVVAALGIIIWTTLGNGGGTDPANPTEVGRFNQLRDSLRTELDNIGPNIDVVPPDVLRSLVSRCHELELYADKDKVSPLCDAIQRAHDNKDPALVDQIVAQLAQLTPK